MNLYAIIGNPVKHSISPRMHNIAFKTLHVNAVYTRYCLKDYKKLKESFYKLKLCGANVTVPYKEDAFAQCDEVIGIAKDIKAVNTLILKKDKLIGYNTDAGGFLMAIKDLPIKSALILGAGGTAKAISFALKNENIKVSILNRSKKRLEDFPLFDAFTWENFKQEKYDIVINTTSAGLNDQCLPAPKDILLPILKESKFAFDVIYNKQTPFILTCKDMNLTCKDGSDMLLYQGVLAFNLFFDNKYDEKELIKIMQEVFML